MSLGRILLVDDEPDIVEIFEMLLEDEGYTVDSAYSGEEAWEKYQQNGFDRFRKFYKIRLNPLYNINQK